MRNLKFKTLAFLTAGLVCAAAVSGTTYAAFQTRKQLSDVAFSVKRVLYLDVRESSAWNSDSTKFSVYLFGHETESACFANNAFMDSVATNVYRISIPSGFAKIVFVKQSNSDNSPRFGGLQTVDINLGSYDCFTMALNPSSDTQIPGDGVTKYGGSWSKYSGGNYTHNYGL